MAFRAQDDVIVHRDAEAFAGLCDLPGDLDVGAAGGGIARGVVVDQTRCLDR